MSKAVENPTQAAKEAESWKSTLKSGDGSKEPDQLRKKFDDEVHSMMKEPAAVRQAFFKSLTAGGGDANLPGLTITKDDKGEMVIKEGKQEIYSEAKTQQQLSKDMQIRAGEGPEAVFRREGYSPAQALQMARELKKQTGIGDTGFKEGDKYSFSDDGGVVRSVKNANGGETQTYFKDGRKTRTDKTDGINNRDSETYREDGSVSSRISEDGAGKKKVTEAYSDDGKTVKTRETIDKQTGAKTTTIYRQDSDKRESEVIQEGGQTTTTKFQADGQTPISKEVEKDGTKDTTTFKPDGIHPDQRIITGADKTTTIKFGKDNNMSEIDVDTAGVGGSGSTRKETKIGADGKPTSESTYTRGPKGELVKSEQATFDGSKVTSRTVEDFVAKKKQTEEYDGDMTIKTFYDEQSKASRRVTYKAGQFVEETDIKDGKKLTVVPRPDHPGEFRVKTDKDSFVVQRKYDPEKGVFVS